MGMASGQQGVVLTTGEKLYHLYLISDSTGETINAVAKAVCARFEDARAVEHSYGLVRSNRQLDKVLQAVEKAPGPVLYSIVQPELTERLEKTCLRLGIPCISVLDPFVNILGPYLGVKIRGRPGGQHAMTKEYFDRIAALNYTVAHDDGQSQGDLDEADIVLVGVSRTSKTPTCMYLANRGIKAANVPLVPGIDPTEELMSLTRPLVVGLTTSPDRLVQIRKNRLLSLNEGADTEYINPELVKDETAEARRLFARKGWPIIDVTRRSIEETAAAILNLYQTHKQPADKDAL